MGVKARQTQENVTGARGTANCQRKLTARKHNPSAPRTVKEEGGGYYRVPGREGVVSVRSRIPPPLPEEEEEGTKEGEKESGRRREGHYERGGKKREERERRGSERRGERRKHEGGKRWKEGGGKSAPGGIVALGFYGAGGGGQFDPARVSNLRRKC